MFKNAAKVHINLECVAQEINKFFLSSFRPVQSVDHRSCFIKKTKGIRDKKRSKFDASEFSISLVFRIKNNQKKDEF
jgi:hypothetical protein